MKKAMQTTHHPHSWRMASLFAGLLLCGLAWAARAETASGALPSSLPEAPCTSASAHADYSHMSAFGINSPFDVDYKSPLSGEGKRLWAKSFLWEKAPRLAVDEWVTSQPTAASLKGKFVLVEIWASWCSQSRKAIPLMNALQKKFGKELTVVAVSDEMKDKVEQFAKKTRMDYAVAVDPLGRMKRELGVTGIPHVIIIEPGGGVVWEGFPLLKDYELTEKTVGAILKAGRKH